MLALGAVVLFCLPLMAGSVLLLGLAPAAAVEARQRITTRVSLVNLGVTQMGTD